MNLPPATGKRAGGTGRVQRGDAWLRSTLSIYVGGMPLGRIVEPEDVVGPMLFAGERARYITGRVLHANKGRITP